MIFKEIIFWDALVYFVGSATLMIMVFAIIGTAIVIFKWREKQ